MVKTYVFLGLVLLSSLVWSVGGGIGRTPACSDVWVAGSTLPDDYDGCDMGATLDPPSALDLECADGSTLYVYDEFWAFHGGIIKTSGSALVSLAVPAFAADHHLCAPAGS